MTMKFSKEKLNFSYVLEFQRFSVMEMNEWIWVCLKERVEKESRIEESKY